ncbi:hypothetical protein FBU59_002440 [Linderina macrospora]|uniref:Uncharacterized protein n=1 Tax=Linderina macrospora TaxID=4868 RepID=A0ACC1JBC0_9FUNG|nr:hypothetical protein FBU59_002440 [Linderina macrospora]
MNDLRDLPDSSVANELARAFARKFYDNNREELFRLVLCQHHFLTPDYEEFAEWVSLGYGWAGGGTDFNMLVQMNQYLLSMKFKPIRKYWDAIRNDVVTSLCNLVHHSNTSFDWHSIDGFLWPREHAEKTNSSTGLPPDPTASTAMAVGFNHLLGPTKNESHVSPPINETSGDLGSMSLRSQRTIRRLDTEDAPLVPIPDLSHIPDAISLADQRHHSNPTIDAPAQAESLLASAKRRHTTYMSKATTVAAPGEDLPTVSKPTSSVFEEADPKGKRIEYDSPSASVTLQFSKIAQIVDANSPVRSDSTQQLTPEPFASARTSDHAESNASSLEFPVTSVAAASQPLAENLPQLTSQPQVSGSPKACTLADPNVSLQVPSRQEMVQTGQILKSSAFSYYDTPTISLPQPAGAQMPPVPTLNHPSSTHNQDTVEVLAAASMEVQGAPETVPLQAAQTHGDPHQRTYQPVLPAQYSSVGLAAQTIPSNSGYATPHILQQPYAYQQFPQPPPTQYPLQQLPPPSIASPQYLAPTWQPTTQPQYFQQQPIVQFAPQQPQLQYAPPPPQQQPGYPQQSQQGYPLQTTGPPPAQTPGHSVQPMGSPTAYPAQQPMSNFHLAQMNDAEWDRYTQRMEYQIQLTERLQRAQNPGWSS